MFPVRLVPRALCAVLVLLLGTWVCRLWPVSVQADSGAQRRADVEHRQRITDARGTSPRVVDAGADIWAEVEADWIANDQRFNAGLKATSATPAPADRASGKTADGPSVTTAEDAAGGCDGVKTGLWGFHVASGQTDPWWQVDLGRSFQLDRIVVYNRCDGRADRTANLRILVADEPPTAGASRGDAKRVAPAPMKPESFTLVYRHDGTPFGGVRGAPLEVRFSDRPVTARVVRLGVAGRCSLALDEIEVYSTDDPTVNVALHKPADQVSVSRYSGVGTLSDADFQRLGYQPLQTRASTTDAMAANEGDFSLAHIQAVIGQARELAARLSREAELPALAGHVAELERLAQRATELAAATDAPPTARRELYRRACRVKRQIAFCNPRLAGIDRLLFLKRHDSVGVYHMCDQYYGCNAKPGGGLYVLESPFGEQPRLTDLLAGSVVENGRLRGQKLTGGTFLSPEVSWDGQTILFAYSQAAAWDKYQGAEAYEWTPEYSYHIFRVNADGSGLIQLTDGPTDDFDPCFLPNGRIAFISERRGGYLRCGRHCPVYTLFSMQPDGSDMICLSFHETHEWNPSVTNDGMLVYTRWDYVDRDTNVAHHIWTCYPDGRDPRSFHGNYPARREGRPWMEMRIRAIPDSNKFVASTGAHHGHEFGSLVLIDPRIEDDGGMSQLTRLTPDAPFPEAEGRPIAPFAAYGTPWPLSEQDYLCVYDAQAKNRGVYWLDSQGNRELVYRDPRISCVSPIPLRARRRPPIIPAATSQAAEDKHLDRPATVAVMNVYDADFSWPEGTKIEALRVIQLLPKATPAPNVPRIGAAQQTNARAVLGTVPVEADGSAYFEAPVGKPIYFQAIDQHGTAVQSMRSATYVHPGEQLTCQGCHERKHDPPAVSQSLPLALRRAPSPIQPDVDGSNPFNYVRLVQPVLDRHCVGCHQEKKALDLSGEANGPHGWTRSYAALAEKYGFYFHVTNGSINTGVHGGVRTIPGAFGARAAGLAQYLDESHYGVQLDPEDRHRIDLWLDCNSEFYGAYEGPELQACGQLVKPSLE